MVQKVFRQKFYLKTKDDIVTLLKLDSFYYFSDKKV